MGFPQQFIDAKRWMVRPTGGKQSVSAHETRPIAYEPPEGDEDPNTSYWRWRWSVPSVLATYEQAKSYWDRHPNEVEGLTFVIHPFGQHEPRTRLICLDYDGAITDGQIDAEVRSLIELFDSYTEYSKSRKGLHLFLLVEDCPAFANCLRKSYGECSVDLLCSNAVNVTGDIYEGFSELRTVSYNEIVSLPFFEFKEPKGAYHERPEWWDEEPINDVPNHLRFLIPHMQMETAVEGEGGSLVLFAAACRLMRHGVVGREAEALLRMVPAVPPFPPCQIQRVVECAYNQTVHDDEFDDVTPEFEQFELPRESDEQTPEQDREGRYGFEYFTAKELHEKDLKLEFLVDGAFVGEGPMFIGGVQKSFKTCIAGDLALSLATKTPFLNHFTVLEQRSIVFFTAEIGLARAKQFFTAACQARDLSLGSVEGFDIVGQIPTFQVDKFDRTKPANPETVLGLNRYFWDRKPQVAIFDPLYLALAGAAMSDMYEMGAVLDFIATLCKNHSVWPIFCHHAKKLQTEEYRPMQLDDLYGSGIGAYTRQWILLSHAAPLKGGIATLYANIGGSSQGPRGIYEIQVDEGQPDELVDRTWKVTVEEFSDDDEDHPTTVTAETVYDALHGGEDERMTVPQIAKALNQPKQKRKVEEHLRELIVQNRVKMVGGKFSVNLGEF